MTKSRVYIADKIYQLMDDLLNNGFNSYTFNNTGLMDSLLVSEVALKTPRVAYYLLIYVLKSNKKPTEYFSLGDKIITPHDEFGDVSWIIIGKGIDGADRLTLLSEEVITLRCFDAKEDDKTDIDRLKYGNNHYKNSCLLQYLNSLSLPGRWWTSKYEYDRQPHSIESYIEGNLFNTSTVSSYWEEFNYENKAGFLRGFDCVFTESLKQVIKETTANMERADDATQENVQSKVFMLSKSEIGLGSVAATYPYIKEAGLLVANSSKHLKKLLNELKLSQGYTPTQVNSKPYYDNVYGEFADTKQQVWAWWLRNQGESVGSKTYVDAVTPKGNLYMHIHAAFATMGIRPAIVV